MSTFDEVYGKVTRVLVDALNVEEDDVTPAATLGGDLGAESIDFLDIVFRLERTFAIQIPRGELFPDSIFQGDREFVQDGIVTDRGMEELRSRMPYADLSNFDDDRRLDAIPNLFTVGLVARYIEWKVGRADGAGRARPGVAPVASSHAHQKSSPDRSQPRIGTLIAERAGVDGYRSGATHSNDAA